jgi:hypothetical protein
MKTNELIQELRSWADKMALPGRRTLITEAADRMEELDERIAIMEEGCALSGPSGQLIIGPGADVDLAPILEAMEAQNSRLIEEE